MQPVSANQQEIKLISKTSYVDGQRREEVLYDANGLLANKASYDANGQKHGLQISCPPLDSQVKATINNTPVVWCNGTPIYNTNDLLADNKETTVVHEKYPSGQLHAELRYNADKQPHGKQTFWYENGQQQAAYNYVNGVQQGIQLDWHFNGKVAIQYSYLNGEQHGKQRRWYENGQLELERNYENGELHGTTTGWYENGQKMYEWNFVHGEYHGTHRGWFDSGVQQYEWNYRNGHEHGIQRGWDFDGKALFERTMVNGYKQ
jgi:antitoxin component YwqK of YwqJK toxin-antitoxin module